MYKLYENTNGNKKLIMESNNLKEIEAYQKEMIVKYADCNTSYDIE